MSTRYARIPSPRLLVGLGLVVWVAAAMASGSSDAGESRTGCAVPVEISGLPPDASFAPVSCSIDLSAMLTRLKVACAVDERSVRLFRLLPDGKQAEEPVQFSAEPQPAAKPRRMLPGTVPGVSYITEFAANETPAVRVAGTLAWIARAGGDGTARYRLEFGVPRDGRVIQVPYPPQNLRVFDRQGRATPVPYFPRMRIRPQWPLDGVLHLSEQQQAVTTYHIGPGADQPLAPGAIRRPFFYPLIGPDGVSLTEFGKPHDPTGSHAHHYSLWIAHSQVAGQDFWSEKGGVIAHEKLELLDDGPVFCRLVQATRWVREGKPYLRDRRTWTLYRSAGDFRLLDLELEVTPAGTEAVELGKTTFGFVAVRVAQSMTPFDGGGEIRNARGDLNEHAVLWKRAEWVDQSGPIAATESEATETRPTARVRWGGIAVFDHPGNPNHPPVWHCRNDGWAGAAFNAEGPTTLAAGQKLRLRYRFHLHRHNAADGKVAERYAEYRAEPAIRIGEPEGRK